MFDLIKIELDIHHLFLAYKGHWRNHQNQTIIDRVRKTKVSSTFLIRLRFQGYLCKSDIYILVTLYYTYIPFKILFYCKRKIIKIGFFKINLVPKLTNCNKQTKFIVYRILVMDKDFSKEMALSYKR